MVINERDILGTQLIKRNEELALLYEKIKIQKKIVLEKERRNLDCSQFSELLSAEENLKNINQEEMNRRLNKCRYRGEPCRYD